jgi:hypothetical protein
MTLLSEKIVVTAKEFLSEKNINDNADLNETIYQVKLMEYDWNMQFSAASITCEIIWKHAIGRSSVSEWRQLDKLFVPSPIGTYANFRGCNSYKSGNVPEVGALAFWKRGNSSWMGAMGIVTKVEKNKQSFDIIEGRLMSGSDNKFITVMESAGKKTGLPFKEDKLNLIGFIYCKPGEIR